MKETCDPYVFIEEQREGYIRYRSTNGRRWEVYGTCTGIGKCFEGTVSPKPVLDCPISPEFKTDCCKFTIIELDNGN